MSSLEGFIKMVSISNARESAYILTINKDKRLCKKYCFGK